MEENDNVSQYKDAEYKIGGTGTIESNDFIYTTGVDTTIRIPEGTKVRYNLSIPWLNLGTDVFGTLNTKVIFCINENVKWYTILMFKLLGCKLEDLDAAKVKLHKPKVPLKQQIYNKLNNLLKKLLKVEDTK